jgi:dTDP-4-dehydrorhamnose reductase
MANLLVTGATGLLGSSLSPLLERRFALTRAARRAPEPGVHRCDLTDGAATRQLLADVRPNIVVHLAALTDVDACEKSPAVAYAVNARATQTIVEWIVAESPATRLVYVSTDQVYDAPGPSGEDSVSPRNIYALTKLWGEDHARHVERHTVLRTNFFAGQAASGKGIVPWLVTKAHAKTPALLFADVLFNPLHAEHLAALIAEAIDRDIRGTFNLGASGDGMSKAAFFRSAARRLGLPDGNFRDGSVADAGLQGYRPRDMRMDVSKAERAFGRALPTIDDGLDLVADHGRTAA